MVIDLTLLVGGIECLCCYWREAFVVILLCRLGVVSFGAVAAGGSGFRGPYCLVGCEVCYMFGFRACSGRGPSEFDFVRVRGRFATYCFGIPRFRIFGAWFLLLGV